MILLIIQIKKKLKTMKMNKSILASSIITTALVMSTTTGQTQSDPPADTEDSVLIIKGLPD
jgi:hypothetical protein